jgi:hypothetical protein
VAWRGIHDAVSLPVVIIEVADATSRGILAVQGIDTEQQYTSRSSFLEGGRSLAIVNPLRCFPRYIRLLWPRLGILNPFWKTIKVDHQLQPTDFMKFWIAYRDPRLVLVYLMSESVHRYYVSRTYSTKSTVSPPEDCIQLRTRQDPVLNFAGSQRIED